MKTTFAFILLALSLPRLSACGAPPIDSNLAVSADSATAEAAIARLRATGQSGLDALFRWHSEGIARLSDPGTCGDPTLAPLRHALEKVAAQRDAHAAHLYWYTDLAAARAAAEAQGKPILSLRLLGKLDEEFSCANSRFFRTALYANKDVSAYLRENFVLHWQTVRPVPRMTIDFGDGRVVERTITGNSIHYLLTPGGEVVDALPGLYSPSAFRTALQPAAELARAVAGRPVPERAMRLAGWHRVSAAALAQQWEVETGLSQQQGAAPVQAITLQMADSPPVPVRPASSQQLALPVARPVALQLAAAPPPTALAAADRAASKSLVERPALERSPRRRGAATTPMTEEERLSRLAEILRLQVRMDANSVALLRAKHTTQEPVAGVVDCFEQSMAEDTARNEYVLHRQLHEWLAAAHVPPALDALNARVYAELFLTPDSDPWLGLVPEQTYSALDGDGRRAK